ncbi:dachshund family transcription factor 2, transcript variant X10 [Ictidomys tridecemlineatus]|uniref:dachshund homolog 2 isoform X14 n=1 Tax=Ictidomys tridecemlineatus TaxID=43179 RepID=UPI000B547FA9|nr:dachshund homolog 2 isoform X14 [Ictidomys tridecemlineatus]KAG3272544.1 dachshund family transcription factor 2, transcript variant X10 [Ictidomys tridecemlineatus]
MSVSAPPVISATSSGTGVPGALFRAEPLYSTPGEPPRLTPNMINSFMANNHSGSAGSGGVGSGSVGSCNTNTNECRMVDMHGVKVASFLMDGQELICLPQVFDLFLKHLVGGLHTVYTKLKRLDISPVVCTVEQVRILRGLGAIQPGVNRCKLITRKDFETLFTDCTNASSRPGRPPKRSLGVLQDNARLLPHAVPGLLSPGLITPTGITAAAMAEAMKLQKMKLMAMNTLQGNGSQNGTESEADDLNSNTGGSESSWDKDKMQSPLAAPGPQHGIAHAALAGQPGLGGAPTLTPLQQNHLLTNRLDLPFMMMPHPLLPVSLPPASVAMAMNQMNHLNTIANMAAAAQIHSPLSRAGASVIKERIPESPSPAPSLEESHRPGSQTSSHPSSSVSSSPSQMDHQSERMEEVPVQIPLMKSPLDKLQLAPGQALPPGFPGPFIFADNLSSVETLLTNIQGLLKVALDNARIQEKQIQQEKKELRMELYREREIRENLERQLAVELQSRTTMQKRLKKEKKAKRKLQEALEFESKRREQVEQALKQATTSDSGLRMLKDTGIPDIEIEKNGTPHDSAAMQGGNYYCLAMAQQFYSA